MSHDTSALSPHHVDKLGDEVVSQRRGAPADQIAQHMEKVAIGALLLIMAGRLSGVAVHTSGCSLCSVDISDPTGNRWPPRNLNCC